MIWFDYLCKDHTSKQVHILRYWGGVGLHSIFLGEYSSICNTFHLCFHLSKLYLLSCFIKYDCVQPAGPPADFYISVWYRQTGDEVQPL